MTADTVLPTPFKKFLAGISAIKWDKNGNNKSKTRDEVEEEKEAKLLKESKTELAMVRTRIFKSL